MKNVCSLVTLQCTQYLFSKLSAGGVSVIGDRLLDAQDISRFWMAEPISLKRENVVGLRQWHALRQIYVMANKKVRERERERERERGRERERER